MPSLQPVSPGVIRRVVLPPISTEPRRVSHAWWRWGRRILVIGVLAGVVVALRFSYFRPVLVPVTLTRVDSGTVEEIVTNNKAGTLTAQRRAAISPEIGGRIAELPAHEGRRVRKGAVLLVLASEDLRAQLALQERSLEAARAAATEACTSADLAARDLDRVRPLVAAGLLSRQDLDRAESQRTATRASCAAAIARGDQSAASVALAQVALSKATLRAPFDAVVSKVSAHVGEWITPSPSGLPMPPALELTDVRSIYVRAPLDEVDSGKVRAGLPVRVTMDAFPGRSFAGTVTRVGAYVSEVQQQNRTFDIDVALDDGAFAETLLPGTSADVEVILQTRAGVVRVPTSAILQGSRVLVARDGALAGIAVGTGLANWEFTEITEGLKPGDAIVTSLDRPEVKEGARIQVEPERRK